MTTIAVLAGPERRRRWTLAEKGRIVEESLAPEASVVEVARRHDIHPNLLHLWRRQARTGSLAPVRRAEHAAADEVRFAAVAVAPDERVLTAPPGVIEVEFASGARLRITGAVDAATARLPLRRWRAASDGDDCLACGGAGMACDRPHGHAQGL